MENIIEKLEQIDSKNIRDGVSQHYIEISQANGEVVLAGNKEGLIWLALQALKLSTREVGSHLHIDEAGMADSAQVNIVIANVKSKNS